MLTRLAPSKAHGRNIGSKKGSFYSHASATPAAGNEKIPADLFAVSLKSAQHI